MEAERIQVSGQRLHKKDLNPDPFLQFEAWLETAKLKSGLPNPNACSLASLSPEGWPEARMVLLKSMDRLGFVFFTNFESDKGRSLLAQPRTELLFHWDSLGRQVRVRGAAKAVSAGEADAYFASRPRASQIGAWASDQSREVASREAMDARYLEFEKRFEGKDVPRPLHWSGFRVSPVRFEFWQADLNRFHDRFQYLKDGGAWLIKRLFP